MAKKEDNDSFEEKIKIINKCNRSIEVCIQMKYCRLEPFGKVGDSMIIKKDNLKELSSDLDNLLVVEV